MRRLVGDRLGGASGDLQQRFTAAGAHVEHPFRACRGLRYHFGVAPRQRSADWRPAPSQLKSHPSKGRQSASSTPVSKLTSGCAEVFPVGTPGFGTIRRASLSGSSDMPEILADVTGMSRYDLEWQPAAVDSAIRRRGLVRVHSIAKLHERGHDTAAGVLVTDGAAGSIAVSEAGRAWIGAERRRTAGRADLLRLRPVSANETAQPGRHCRYGWRSWRHRLRR